MGAGVVGHDASVTKPATSILDRPVYGVSEAAGLLGLRADRGQAWLDGYERQGALYAPVIRVEPTGQDVVSWGEFVELGYLREYRRKENGIPPAIAIVIRSGQQIFLADDAQRFFKKVEFDAPEDGDVLRLRPAGTASPVVIDPLVRFGRPSVQGVATERLWELYDAGESIEQIAGG
jgi:hypothetical protein